MSLPHGTTELSQSPVLVVGAGPVGLSAALMLARHGTAVRVIDGNAGPTHLSKALVLWQRTLELLGPVLPYQSFSADHPVLQRAVIDLGSSTRTVEVEFPWQDGAVPPCIMIPQSDTERILLQRLEQFGVSVERHTTLSHFQADDDGVSCELAGPGGATQQVRTPWLVGCDGGHSAVRKRLALEFPGETVTNRWLLADFEIEADPRPDDHHLEIHLSDGIAALFPIGAGRWRLIADLGTAAASAAGSAEGELRTVSREEIQAALDQRTQSGWQVTAVHWTSEFGVNERQVEEYVHGRVVLAGDAAHVHSPAGGQGMNTGIQDAANLAWKIALVQRGAAPADLLSSYQAERHPVGAAVVRQSGLMLKAALATGPVRFARDHLAPLALSLAPVQRLFIGFLTEEAISYRKGPLADGTGHHNSAQSGDGWPLSAGAQAELVLLGDAAQDDAPETFGGPAGFPLTVTRVATDSRLAERLGRSSGAILIRPDGVVASVGKDAKAALGWIAANLTPVDVTSS